MSRYDPPDPVCHHLRQTVRVSSHVDLVAANRAGEPLASTYCCEREECLDDAREWVRAVTRRDAVHVIPRRVAS